MPDHRSAEAAQYRKLYKTQAWKATRRQQLQQEPLCRMCMVAGRVIAATVADHVRPHKGDRVLFFDAANLQSLCAPCHDGAKQQQERLGYSTQIGYDGWPVDDNHPANGGKVVRVDGLGAYSHPRWFRPVFVPLTIVCGPPASGKTTYVATNKGERDIVFDLDAIALKLHGKRVSLLDKDRMLDCIKHRNQGLADLMWAKAKGSCDRAWLIVAEPAAHKRQWWIDTVKPDQVVVIETSAAECIARSKTDNGAARSSTVEVSIRKWWDTYTRRPGDVVITP